MFSRKFSEAYNLTLTYQTMTMALILLIGLRFLFRILNVMNLCRTGSMYILCTKLIGFGLKVTFVLYKFETCVLCTRLFLVYKQITAICHDLSIVIIIGLVLTINKHAKNVTRRKIVWQQYIFGI